MKYVHVTNDYALLNKFSLLLLWNVPFFPAILYFEIYFNFLLLFVWHNYLIYFHLSLSISSAYLFHFKKPEV